MNTGFMAESVYIGEYTYREHVFHTRGTRFPGYDHEVYDGTDEADPFRNESGAEMAAKGSDNALLLPGHMRPGAGAPRGSVDVVCDGDSDGGDGSKTPTAAPAMAAVARDVGKYVAPQRRARGKQTLAKTLDLHAVLSDAAVQKKYSFDSVFVAQLRVIKDSSAVEAAAMAQEFLRERGNEVTIVKTDRVSSYTRSEAIAELASYASMCNVKPGYMDAKIILSKRGDTLHLLPAPFTKDAAEADEWEIMSPIAHAKHAVDYYRLVSERGYDDAHVLAGQAAAVLGISVVFTSPRLAMMHPSRVPHAAIADVNTPFDYSEFSVTRDPVLLEVAKATGPITLRGLHSSFAVAVAGKVRLLNEHMRRKATTVKYAGKELRKFQTYRLHNDMWAFYDTAHNGELHGVARTRAPVVSERVRVVLPTSSGDVMTTQWATIRPGRDAVWVLDLPNAHSVMQPGMSGAPIVAVDGAVVGIHDGLTSLNAVFLPVPETISGDVPMELALDRCLAYGPPDSPHLALIEFDLRKKSKLYRTNNELVMHAMDNDEYRTMLSCYDKRMYVSGRSGDVAVPGLEFKLTSTGARGKSGSLPIRAASVGEQVVIIGKTKDGIYGTPVLCTQDIGASPFFAVDLCGDFGPKEFLNGALVVAIDDCMVVGFVSSQGVVSYGASDTVIMAWKCHDVVIVDEMNDQLADLRVGGLAEGSKSHPMTHRHSSSGASTSASSDMFTYVGVAATIAGSESVEILRQELAVHFPFLPIADESLFPAGGLDEVFTHGSMGKYAESIRTPFSSNRYWARMGDAAMSYLMTKQMFEKGIADEKATIIKSKVQNATVQAAVARKYRFHEMIRHKRGVVLADHTVSDILEAFFGYVVNCVGLESPLTTKLLDVIDMSCRVNDSYI